MEATVTAQGFLADLTDAPLAGRGRVGAKAAVLGELLAAGFPVLPGVVVTAAALDHPDTFGAGLTAAAGQFGPGPFAVRSSATAEDLPDASYAGLYESYLDVPLDQLPAAVRRCFAAATSARVRGYAALRADSGTAPGTSTAPTPAPAMAVLVQPMVPADAAGVAFTAHPVTGARDEVVVTAVPGLGEALVAGHAAGEEWTARGDGLDRTRPSDAQVLHAAQAREVADLARRVAGHFGGTPQDVEWALAGDRLVLLQARPMTALPDPVSWNPSGPGLWSRNFRLGEWLPEAMTPLFEHWLLPAVEDGYLTGMRATLGVTVPFRYATVNGWYYNAPPIPSPRLLARILVRGRGRAVRVLVNALVRVGRDPVAADRAVLAGLYRQWRQEQLATYRRLVADGEQAVTRADPERLGDIVDQVGAAAGTHLWFLAVVGGSAWKMEARLLRFCRTHLPQTLETDLDGSVQVLLRGLPGAAPHLAPHAVTSLDWYHPTAGELPQPPAARLPRPPDAGLPDRRADLARQREGATAACRAALAGQPQLLARFDALLEVTQRYTVIREEQARDLSLGWPLLRRCALRLGAHLHILGALTDPSDVFFLTRAELDDPGPHDAAAAARRTRWEQQRRLSAPLTLGAPTRLIGDVIARTADAARGRPTEADAMVVGHPASAGRATGPVRLVTGPQDFAAFSAGEVLLAKATAPAWTPLFARAAAVITDGGTLAAHASLLAREYGIPAVVATGDATHRLTTGHLVTVDGTAGTVHLLPAPSRPDRATAAPRATVH